MLDLTKIDEKYLINDEAKTLVGVRERVIPLPVKKYIKVA